MIAFVIDEKLFGEVFSYVRVTEFQERELLNGRCIFILFGESKVAFMQPEFICTVNYSQISSFQNQMPPNVIPKRNLHQPCGELNPTSVSMKGRYCSKNRKEFIKETGQDEVQFYVIYRHRHPLDGDATAPWQYHNPKWLRSHRKSW